MNALVWSVFLLLAIYICVGNTCLISSTYRIRRIFVHRLCFAWLTHCR